MYIHVRMLHIHAIYIYVPQQIAMLACCYNYCRNGLASTYSKHTEHVADGWNNVH